VKIIHISSYKIKYLTHTLTKLKNKMKIATSLIFLAPAASAFVVQNNKPINGLHMSETSIEEISEASTDFTPAEPIMSQSMPFMQRPATLTGELAGDVGFDPLGFAKSKEDLMNYREAEIKHGRLAMLAAAGWPLSEVLDKKIANALHMAPVLDVSDRAPSVLNGGLGKISPLYWIGCLAVAAAIDGFGIYRSKNASEYIPGDFGFDPLGMYPKDEEGKMNMQLSEIKHGRLAMIAITAFAAQEFVSKIGVIDETPVFFFPLNAVLKAYANSGYIQ